MIILHVLEPFASGVSTAVCSIIKELPDFSHVVIHGNRNLTENTEKVKLRFPCGVTFIEWKYAAREIDLINDLKALKEIKKILKPYKARKETEPFVVHLNSSKAGFLGRLACRMLRIKEVIYTPHCGAFLRKDINSFKRRLYWFFEWIGSRFGGRVVGCGRAEGEYYKKIEINTTYVSNGVDLKPINNTENDRTLVSFTGIASVQKDPVLWNSIACASASLAKENGFSFCWVGDGPGVVNFDKQYIDITGWKSAQEVDEYLNRTAIYLSSSAWEGLPYGALEAMNSGCALLLRNVPGNNELVIQNENGFLFNSKEEAVSRLSQMIKDKNVLSAMGKKSRKIIEQRYTLTMMGNSYRRIYLDLQKR